MPAFDRQHSVKDMFCQVQVSSPCTRTRVGRLCLFASISAKRFGGSGGSPSAIRSPFVLGSGPRLTVPRYSSSREKTGAEKSVMEMKKI